MLGIKLRIVIGDDIRPHEIADPGREQRIEGRLHEDGVLRDPLMVAEIRGIAGYVLLDGTNRKRALASLGLRYALAQVIDYADENAVALRAWCHEVDEPIDALLEGASTIPQLSITPVAPLGTTDALRQPGSLALLLNRRDQHILSHGHGKESSTSSLRRLVHCYEDRMQRVDCSPDEVEERAQSLGNGKTLVAFPGFSRSQVVTMAMRGALIPAGITRHVIRVGRALRVNVPLELLSGSMDLVEANDALQHHLKTLQPRVYREPTILYDS